MKHFRYIISAFQNSKSGAMYMLKERAFIQELCLIPFIVLYIYFIKNEFYQLYFLSSYVFVLVVECINTCFETTINRISKDYHELSKKTKDIGSFLVFIAISHLIIVTAIGTYKYIL